MSDLSDILSGVRQTNSRTLVVESQVSDVYSLLSDVQSDFQSRVPKLVATASQLSDLHSDVRSYLVGMSGILSDTYSAAAQTTDRRAAALLIQEGDIYSLLNDVRVDVGVLSAVDDNTYSLLWSLESDIQSRFPAVPLQK